MLIKQGLMVKMVSDLESSWLTCMEKVSSYIILGDLVKKLFFSDGARCHFEFGPLAKNDGIFARDRGLNLV